MRIRIHSTGFRKNNMFYTVFRIRIRTDLHKKMPPGSGSTWTDADPNPDPGVEKAYLGPYLDQQGSSHKYPK